MNLLTPASPPRQPLALTLLAALLLAAAVILVAPWQPVDPDALSHLAIGRTIAEMGTVPATDPLTFSAPGVRWSNPEWLGDLLFYLVHDSAGETGLLIYKLLLITLGWLLAFRLCLRQGSAASLAAALLLLVLLGASARFTLRNQIHAYWLVPLYGLILLRSRDRPGLLLLLLPLGALWANLHGSFLLGWVLVAARLTGAVVRPDRQRRELGALAGLLALHPLLGLASPQGIYNYGQVLDHLIGAGVYRALILEWLPPGDAPGVLRMLPLHLIGLVGLASFLPSINRRRAEAFLLLAAGLALAHSSQRFLPLLAVLAVPGVATNLTRWMASTSPRFQTRVGLAALLLAAGLLIPVIRVVRSDGRPHVLQRPDAPLAAARFLSRHVARAQIFNPFNAGPWLLWEVTRCQDGCPDGAARRRIYIDPRNNLGHAALERYHRRVRPDPVAFEREARLRRIDTALLDLSDGHDRALNAHLDAAARWRLVYTDGRHVIHVRRPRTGGDPLGAVGYELLRAGGGLEYLLAPGGRAPRPGWSGALSRDARRLTRQSPPLAKILEAYRLLAANGGPPPRLPGPSRVRPWHGPGRSPGPASPAVRKARTLLEHALPQLPPSAHRLVYLATACARGGDGPAARVLLEQAEAIFSDEPMVLALKLELARDEGDRRELARLTARLQQRAPRGHPIWALLSGGPALEVPR